MKNSEGRVLLMNYRGKYKNFMPGVDTDALTVKDEEDGLNIEVRIAVRFGTSISDVCREMLEYMSSEVERVMMEKPVLIRVIVTAVVSKEIAMRHIVFEKRENES